MPAERDTREVLRLVTSGSVDDGKSTLVGRLLHDARALYDDHINALDAHARSTGGTIDFSLVTDGLRAEREQGITIDVAYRYFSTARRRFIVADAPGHEQYTRNMATAASRADVAVLLLDATRGVVEQSKRHAFICALMGIRTFVVVVNKMDLVDYREQRYREIQHEYREFSARLGLGALFFVPACATTGDNVVEPSANMAWYVGPPILPMLDDVVVGSRRNLIDFRLAVQHVIRAGPRSRAYGGRVASGVLRSGDTVLVLPSGIRTRVSAISIGRLPVSIAVAGQSVTVQIEDDLDVSSGDVLVHPLNSPRERDHLDVMVAWTGAEALRPTGTYWLKHATGWRRATCEAVYYRTQPATLRREEADALFANDIGRARFAMVTPLFADEYRDNREFGSLTVVSAHDNATLGAATITDRIDHDAGHVSSLSSTTRQGAATQAAVVPSEPITEHDTDRPFTVWMTGLSGSGKSTIAFALRHALMEAGYPSYVLDGDNVRRGLNADLGFSAKDRSENIRRVAEVARLMNDAGLIVLAALISPTRADRQAAREIIGEACFVEVFVSASLAVAERRDPKGLYKRARHGEIRDFTGVSAPYETPEAPAVVVDTERSSVDECVHFLLAALRPALVRRARS